MARVVSKRATGSLYIADSNILLCIVLRIEKEGKPKLALPIYFLSFIFCIIKADTGQIIINPQKIKSAIISLIIILTFNPYY